MLSQFTKSPVLPLLFCLCFVAVMLQKMEPELVHGAATVDVFQAVDKDERTAIEGAIGRGADENAVGPNGQTPLLHAIWWNKAGRITSLSSSSSKEGFFPSASESG